MRERWPKLRRSSGANQRALRKSAAFNVIGEPPSCFPANAARHPERAGIVGHFQLVCMRIHILCQTAKDAGRRRSFRPRSTGETILCPGLLTGKNPRAIELCMRIHSDPWLTGPPAGFVGGRRADPRCGSAAATPAMPVTPGGEKMNGLLRALGLAAGLAGIIAMTGAAGAAELPNNLRMVIGSNSTGGDTYQDSAIVADALSKQLGINVKVDAVGADRAFKALDRDSRGTTIMIFHDQSYLGHLYGVKGYEDIFSHLQDRPDPRDQSGQCLSGRRRIRPTRRSDDVLDAAANGKRVRVAIQPGGVSEIGFSALKNAATLNIAGLGRQHRPGQYRIAGRQEPAAVRRPGRCHQRLGAGERAIHAAAGRRPEGHALHLAHRRARRRIEQASTRTGLATPRREQLLQYATPKATVTLDGKQGLHLRQGILLHLQQGHGSGAGRRDR